MAQERSRWRKSCERLTLTEQTKRRLWSESGGYCENPLCEESLFDDIVDLHFAEMAHIVAASSDGPRDVPQQEMSAEDRARHSNVVVLCANCHTKVDKAPDAYPREALLSWKARHQDKLRGIFGTPEFAIRREARTYVEPLLAANRAVHERYAPLEGDFSEGRASQWRRHVATTIVPNNATLERFLRQNRHLLTDAERLTADAFALHNREFTARHLLDDWSTGGTRFPEAMSHVLEEESS